MTIAKDEIIEHIGASLEKAHNYKKEIEKMKNAYRDIGVWVCDEFGDKRYSVHVLESSLKILADAYRASVISTYRTEQTTRDSIYIPYNETTIEFYAIRDTPLLCGIDVMVNSTCNAIDTDVEGVRA